MVGYKTGADVVAETFFMAFGMITAEDRGFGAVPVAGVGASAADFDVLGAASVGK